MSSIKLEVGKHYRARNGAVFGPLTLDEHTDTQYVFLGRGGDGFLRCWRWDGSHYTTKQSEWDIVEEVPAPCPVVKALDAMEVAAQAEQQADAAGAGLKFDAGKPPIGLIPAAAITAEAEVLAFGAQKYDAHNWRRGMRWSRLGDAAARHLFAWLNGEDLDPETGLHHLAHVRCCSGFLLEYAQTGAGTDDRYKAFV